MVGNEEENESDSEEEHSSEEESGNFVLLIFGSCFFVLFTGCFWAKKEVRRHVQKKWLHIIYEQCTISISRVFDVKVNQIRYERLTFLLPVVFNASRTQWTFE